MQIDLFSYLKRLFFQDAKITGSQGADKLIQYSKGGFYMSILILYSTTDGQTSRISRKIGDFLQENNQTVEIHDLSQVSRLDVGNFDLVVIGASIRYGHHQKKVADWITEHLNVLKTVKTVFFTVNLVARKAEKATPETNNYLKKFLQKVTWQPDIAAVFAGRLDYPRYGFLDKFMIRLIMAMTKGPTDTGQSYEFTDWGQVDKLARQTLKLSQKASLVDS